METREDELLLRSLEEEAVLSSSTVGIQRGGKSPDIPHEDGLQMQRSEEDRPILAPRKVAGDAARAQSWVSVSSFMMERSLTSAQNVGRASIRDLT